MSNARNLANIISGGFDIPSAALDNAVPADGSITAAKLASTLNLTGKTVTLPSGVGGKILQVAEAYYNGSVTVSADASNWQNVPNSSASITPSSSSSKILVFNRFFGYIATDGSDTAIRVVRNGTALFGNTSAASGNSAGSPGTIRNFGQANSIHYETFGLDAPATTSQVTYSLQQISEQVVVYGRGNQSGHVRFTDDKCFSWILIEVAA